MTQCPIEDRLALEDLTIAYAHAVDSLTDLDGVVACFTPDADYDLSGIGFPHVTGRDGIREFMGATFAANSHHAHYLSNFAVTAYGGNTASIRCYVRGLGRGKDGSSIEVHARYYFDAVRSAEGWLFARYTMDFMLPLG